MIEIKKISETEIAVYTPYNAQFVSDLKAQISGRKWNPADKSWICNASDRDVIVNLLSKHYNYSESGSYITVIITAIDDLYEYNDSVRFSGLPVARATGKDSGAQVTNGVTLLSGRITSTGSIKNWKTFVYANTKFRLTVPENALQNYDKNEWTVEIVKDPVLDQDALQKEKEKLLERIAEIDKLLK